MEPESSVLSRTVSAVIQLNAETRASAARTKFVIWTQPKAPRLSRLSG